MIGVRAADAATIDDPMGQGRPDAGQLGQFRPVGPIDVHLESGACGSARSNSMSLPVRPPCATHQPIVAAKAISTKTATVA